MSEKYTVTVNPDGTMVLQGDQGNVMTVVSPTYSYGGTTSMTAATGSIYTLAPPQPVQAEQEPVAVIAQLVTEAEGRWYCPDCMEWLEGEPEEWTEIEIYFTGDEEDFNKDRESYISRSTYQRASCGCDYEDPDSPCFVHVPRGELTFTCPHCEREFADKDAAESCEEDCRLYG